MQESELGDDIRKDKNITGIEDSTQITLGTFSPTVLVSYILSRMVFLFFSKEN